MIKKLLIVIIFFQNFQSISYSSEKLIWIKYKVNDDLITNFDIFKEKQYLKALNNDLETLAENQLIKIAENSLIKEKIRKNEIEKYYNVNYNSDAVNFFIEDLRKKLGINSQSDFEKYLANYQIDFEELRSKFIIEQTWNKMIISIYEERILIDEKKISEKLEKSIKEKSNQKSYNISEIVFFEKNVEDFKKKYDEIIISIEKLGFEKTAAIYSISNTANENGRIGWVNQSQLSKKILNELQELPIGSFTRPINTAGGALLLYLNDTKEVLIENIDKELELSNIITAEKNRQLNEFSIIHYKKTEKKSYVKKF